MDLFVFISVIELIVIIFLLFFLKNSISLNVEYEERIENIRDQIQEAYDNMKLVDIGGAFESDDEVGFVFQFLLNKIKELNERFNG